MLKVCPVEAISQQGGGLPVIDAEKCIECGRCEKVCRMGAVYMEAGDGKIV